MQVVVQDANGEERVVACAKAPIWAYLSVQVDLYVHAEGDLQQGCQCLGSQVGAAVKGACSQVLVPVPLSMLLLRLLLLLLLHQLSMLYGCAICRPPASHNG